MAVTSPWTLTFPVCAAAEGPGGAAAQSPPEVSSISPDPGRVWLPVPETHLYPLHLADPRRPVFGLQRMHFSRSEIDQAGNDRFGLKLGGRLGLVRRHPEDRIDRGWQLSMEGGFTGQFDIDNSTDNIGWDGVYGLTLSWRSSQALAFKLGALHNTSSHIGDEYIERTGRKRINYTREEMIGGVNWSITDRWQTYVESGWAYDLRNDELQEPWRAQAGLEYAATNSLWRQRLGWYAAVDTNATEERDWDVDTTVQAGFMYQARERVWRLGIEYYNGRSLIGEFFQDDERYIALGFWLDI